MPVVCNKTDKTLHAGVTTDIEEMVLHNAKEILKLAAKKTRVQLILNVITRDIISNVYAHR